MNKRAIIGLFLILGFIVPAIFVGTVNDTTLQPEPQDEANVNTNNFGIQLSDENATIEECKIYIINGYPMQICS